MPGSERRREKDVEMYALVHVLTMIFVERPRLAGAIGLVFAVLCAALGVDSWMKMQALPIQPEQLPLEAVAGKLSDQDRVWATIAGTVDWDCATLRYEVVGQDTHTELAFTAGEGTVMVWATFNRQLACPEIEAGQATGVFYKMSERYLDTLTEKGFDFGRYARATVFLELCTVCSRGNDGGLVILCAVFALVGLAIYPLSLWANRHERRRILPATNEAGLAGRSSAQQPFRLTVSVAGWAKFFLTVPAFLLALPATLGALQGSGEALVIAILFACLGLFGWILTSSAIRVTEESVTVTVFYGHFRIRWDEVERICVNGPLIAFTGSDKRVVVSLKQAGRERHRLLDYIRYQVERRRLSCETGASFPITHLNARVRR
jgi:hypothetical protein